MEQIAAQALELGFNGLTIFGLVVALFGLWMLKERGLWGNWAGGTCFVLGAFIVALS